MTRLDVLCRIPQESRDLIRRWEGVLEDMIITPFADQHLELCAKKNIRYLLSLYFKGDDLDQAEKALRLGNATDKVNS